MRCAEATIEGSASERANFQQISYVALNDVALDCHAQTSVKVDNGSTTYRETGR
jgi:hypothetical protein